MTQHSAFTEDNVAVITGGADGIGFAAAQYFKSIGMRICIADINPDKLQQAKAALGEILAITLDVSELNEVQALRDRVYDVYGRVDVLMNNAGTAMPCTSWSGYDNWQSIIDVNLWGVINGVQSFTQAMVEQKSPALIVNTSSKQGITAPPGNPAYNVSKAGVKAVTEALQYELRNTADCQVSAHLLIPGFTYTGMIKRFLKDKPAGAWSSQQVIEYMVASLTKNDFYIVCPDNDTTREMDNRRMAWAMDDVIENRPAMSRWHPEYQAEFEKFMNR